MLKKEDTNQKEEIKREPSVESDDGNEVIAAIYEQNISKQSYERVKDKDSG